MLKMNPLDLIHVQMELECIGTDASNVLFRIPGDDPDDIARFYAAHHAAGYVAFVRYDVEPRIAESLRVSRRNKHLRTKRWSSVYSVAKLQAMFL